MIITSFRTPFGGIVIFVWFDRGISTLEDLNRGHNFIKTFEDLVIEYDISIKDRRKYNYLMKGISIDWFYNPSDVQENIFDKIVGSLFENGKITKYSYNILKTREGPAKTESFWIDVLNLDQDTDWNEVHSNNFSCSIETQLRAFYFKVFHRAICTNKFLHKIGRIDSPLCGFCNNFEESLVHLFCDCDKTKCLWNSLTQFIESKTGVDITISNYQKMFGIDVYDSEHQKVINFLILCMKFYIHRCKFQKTCPSFQAFMNFVRMKLNLEYKIAEGKGKLGKHLKKFTFDLKED